MKFYEWMHDEVETADGNLWIVDFPIDSYNDVWFADCETISDWNVNLIATYPDSEFIHLDFQPCSWPLLSKRLFDFVDRAASNTIQYLPLRLQRPDGTGEVTGYGLGQILTAIDCLDKERTTVADGKWRRMPSGNYPIRGQICLRRDLIGEHSFFRVDGTRVKLIIREDIKDGIQAQGFTGSRFEEVPVSD